MLMIVAIKCSFPTRAGFMLAIQYLILFVKPYLDKSCTLNLMFSLWFHITNSLSKYHLYVPNIKLYNKHVWITHVITFI